MVEFLPLSDIEPQAVEALLDAAFGRTRFGRTAYRIRQGMDAIPALSFAAVEDGVLIGTIQCWPVAHRAGDDSVTPLVMVGPVAVRPDIQRGGHGRTLMAHMLAAAETQADGALMMIGDPEYYGRFFGFAADATGAWDLPGPFEKRRLLARAVNGHTLPTGAGMTEWWVVQRTCARCPCAYVGRMVTPAPSLPKDFAQLSLTEAAELLAARKLPPVEQWHPERAGDSAMEIHADGSWFHEGGRINRPAMIKLFSTILRREADGSHVLVTPAEKLAIAVEDTPFRAVEMKCEGAGETRKLVFRLATDDLVMAGADHPLSFGSDADNPDPRLHVRGAIGNGLEARIDRALYYEIVEMALADGAEPPAIWSNGARFPLVDA